ncbi:MAG: N-acetylmuramoyl-L-alanine amidase [Chloroflexi bacterium]|nr:N-acetylmuramoyl-L-alanine amidase [Chloroflexota bacterium]
MRGRIGPGSLLLVSAAAVAVLVGSIVGQQVMRARSGDGAGASGMLASISDDLADMPEVWSLTELGDELPGGDTMTATVPVPTSAPGAAPVIPPAGRPTATPVLFTRIPKPVLPAGPRRIGIQAGHWETEKAPPELWRLLTQTGTAWGGVTEVQINLDIAKRVRPILEAKGFVVDVLPTTIPPGYVADAFVALHGDGDGTGVNSGFKMAFSSRRTPYEAALLESIKTHYAAATGLGYDGQRVTRQMLGYYAMSWQRNKYATAPHTPSVILEMGYVSNDGDRELMIDRADVIAGGVAEGILRFLADHPREKLFGQDLLVPATAQFGPRPSATPGN